ncbi:MAG: glutaredoxin family protein [Candidatus Binatia bacterium]|nr:glutaredoxin family protein [Candidatus Binatia bacterium]
MLSLTLYARPDCCLCEEMKSTLLAVQREIPFVLEQVDISDDPALTARFGAEIPVLFINGRKAFKYRLSARALRRRLLSEQRVSP